MNASEVAYEMIKSRILTQEFLAGSQLKEMDLCEMTGLTRTPVRAAIVRLESEKLLKCYPNKGAFIVEMSKGEIQDLFEVRECLELKGLDLAGGKASRNEMEQLQQSLLQRKERFNHENEMRYYIPKVDFHYELIKLSKNQILIEMYKGLKTRLQLFQVKSAMHNKRFLNSIDEHLNILQNLYEHNIEEAQELLKRHIQLVKTMLTAKP